VRPDQARPRLGDGVRVLMLDRGVANPYSRGLVGGLRSIGADVVLAGPAGFEDENVVPVFSRAGVPGQKVSKGLDGVVGVGNLARVLAELRPNVLHFQWGTFHNYAMARTLRPLTSAALVFTVHNPTARDTGYRWQPSMIALADALICHGAALQDELERNHPETAGRISVVRHGNYAHAVQRFSRDEARMRLGLPLDGPVYAFFGQLLERKGVDTLLQAFRRHCEAGRPGTLVLAGAAYGVDLEKLRGLVSGYEDRVAWLTRERDLPAEELDLVVSAATMVVLPFHAATQSGSAVYAMTHGRCVVSTEVGELPALLGGRGLVVPPRDDEALAGALALAVDDPARVEELAARGRSFVESELDWTVLAAQTLRVYAQAIGRRNCSILERPLHKQLPT
jgi:glycosyltransferase involved in cell wall biosynthesis